MGFFLSNPVGELLLAFTKDVDIMDENLVDSLHYLGIYGLIMLSTVSAWAGRCMGRGAHGCMLLQPILSTPV